VQFECESSFAQWQSQRCRKYLSRMTGRPRRPCAGHHAIEQMDGIRDRAAAAEICSIVSGAFIGRLDCAKAGTPWETAMLQTSSRVPQRYAIVRAMSEEADLALPA